MTKVELYFRDTVKMLDELFGDGFSKEHPEIVLELVRETRLDKGCKVEIKNKRKNFDGLEKLDSSKFEKDWKFKSF